MSYIERGIYDFFKKSLTDGVKVLLSRKFLFFSVIMAIIGLGTTSIAYLKIAQIGTGLDTMTMQLILFVETALAISLIICGLLAKIFDSTLKKTLLVLIIWIIFAVIGFLTINQNIALFDSVTEIIAVLCLFSWTIFIPLSTAWAAYGLCYSKLTGMILFLGKPKENHNAIFSGIILVLAILGVFLGISLITQDLVTIGVLITIFSIIVMFTTRGRLVKNDAFNTMISFYYVMLIPTCLLLLYSEIGGGGGTAGTLSFLVLAFSLLWSSQGVAKKIKVDRVEKIAEEMSEGKTLDPYGLNRLMSLIGGEGIILVLLGTILGYHVLQLQSILGNTNVDFANTIFQSLFPDRTVSQIYQQLNIGIALLIVCILIFTHWFSKNVKGFYEPTFYRFEFLPPYEELMDLLARHQRGEINIYQYFVQEITKKAARETMKAPIKGTKMVAGMIKNVFTGDRKEEDQ